MNNKKVLIGIISLIVILITGCLFFWLLPWKYDRECKNRVYSELESKAEEAKKSVVGIIPENKTESLVSHNGIGSGVIFKKENDTYYVITALHVIENQDNSYKLFIVNTQFSGKTIEADENVKFEIPDEKYYASLLNANVEYRSDFADLAILSFKSNEIFPVMEFENNDLKIGDKVIAVGHPNGNKYTISYGTIKSNIKEITISTKDTNRNNTDQIMEHNAYLNFGSSGGVLISENKKIAGINIGGAFNIFGYFDKGFMIPYPIVQNVIKEWNLKENSQVNKSESWNKDKVTIKVLAVNKDNLSATIEIIDKNDNPISWGTEFSIQRLSEGNNKWYDLTLKGKIELLKNYVSPDENGIIKMEINWSKIYDALKSGTYRIVKHHQFITLYSESFNIK